MREIALLDYELDGEPKPAFVSWADLCTLLSEFDRRPHKSRKEGALRAPSWVPVSFKRAPSGRYERKKELVDAISYAVIDIDESAPREPITADKLDQIGMAIDLLGLACVIHSSFRYTHEKPKCRIVFRPSRPILPGENSAVREWISEKIGCYIDPSTKDPGRLYFLPAAPEGAETLFVSVEGADLDVDAAVRGRRIEALTARAHNLAADREAQIRARLEGLRASGAPVDLEAIRKALSASRGRNGDLLRAIVRGESVAAEGSRDTTLNLACSAAIFAVPPETPVEALLEVFRRSIAQFDRKTLPTGEVEDWFDAARQKFTRALDRRIAADAARDATNEELFARLRLEASRSGLAQSTTAPVAQTHDVPGATDGAEVGEAPADVGPYSDADLAEWAREQECRDLIDFQRRWIISRADSFYIFVEGRYLPPLPRNNLEHSIVRDLIRAPVELFTTTNNGTRKLREVRSILHDYSTVARSVEASLALQKSFYEPSSQTFFEATTPLRQITPRYHEKIDRWLRLIDPSERLLDWVATVSRLDRQTCAIYIHGHKGIGKTLLPTGLARLWTTGGPTEFARVLEGFNSSLVTCPLVLADESLPQRKGITAELRRLIGSTKRTLSRKFLPDAQLDGAVRVILAANNDRLLDTGEELSAQDLDAIAERIYYLKVGRAPADYLIELGGPTSVTPWVSQDLIAEHALWLRHNRKVNEGGRFLVEGNPTEFHQHLATGSGSAGLVCEWLARWLADPQPLTSGALIQVGSGELWVNTEALAKETAWTRYVPSVQVPTAARIGRALRALSIGTIATEIGGRGVSFHRVEASLILSWIDRLQIGDARGIQTRIKSSNPIISATLEALEKSTA
jgi:hypothetical protein